MGALRDILSDAKAVILAPLTNIVCGAGVLLLVLSFVDYDRVNSLSMHGNAHWTMVAAGSVLIAAGLILFLLTHKGGEIRNTLVS